MCRGLVFFCCCWPLQPCKHLQKSLQNLRPALTPGMRQDFGHRAFFQADQILQQHPNHCRKYQAWRRRTNINGTTLKNSSEQQWINPGTVCMAALPVTAARWLWVLSLFYLFFILKETQGTAALYTRRVLLMLLVVYRDLLRAPMISGLINTLPFPTSLCIKHLEGSTASWKLLLFALEVAGMGVSFPPGGGTWARTSRLSPDLAPLGGCSLLPASR